tara:strand:+ start:887 stop:2215 length:1329 start_codon:yes stop_codon:yes gene_type:complete
MSYKIADFSRVHKVSHVENGSRKYASAVKIGNTNQFGWYEPTTPTEKDKIHTYLDLNYFHPTARNVCLKSKKLWSPWAWNGNYRIHDQFLKNGINLMSGHPSFTNRSAKRSFGNSYDNNWGPNHSRWGYTGYRHCEIDRKNITHTGSKYTVSFWIKANSATRHDGFYYYQNNYPTFVSSDGNDVLLRLINNMSSNQLDASIYPKNNNEVDLVVIQKFVDWKASSYKTYWYNGLKTSIPIGKWVYVNVSIDSNNAMISFNKNIATTKDFKYEDVLYSNLKINKIGARAAEYKGMNPGRNYNFNEISDDKRLHAIGIKSNSVQVADFRVYSNLSFNTPVSKVLSHIQNHRDQLGDLPPNLHSGSFSPELQQQSDDELEPQFQLENNYSPSLVSNLNYALDTTNPRQSRELELRQLSDNNNIDYSLLEDEIFNLNNEEPLDVDEV